MTAATRWLQLTVVLAYVLLTAVHAVLVSWLALIPRYRREGLAWAVIRPVWAGYTQLLVGMRARVFGGEHLPTAVRGCIYAGNHESFLDILMLVREIGHPFLMKRTVLLSPVGWGAYWMGCIGVDRGDRGARRRALDESLEMAERSRSVIVFPEGTFGHADGRLRSPRLGLLRYAFDRKVPVVPFGHAGTRRALDGQKLPVRRGAEVALVVRPAVEPASFADRDSFATACWDEITAAVEQARAAIQPGWPYPDHLPAEDTA
jgi:1-acyl-sn-glycerol-3-phosphate acyltransferase